MSTGKPGPTNPLTTALVVILFTPLNAESAAGVFFGLSSALLAFGLTRHGEWWRLLVFLAFPYWAALQAVQWSPLLFAVALYPALLPLTLVKPHLGLPVALTHLSWKRGAACAAFGLGSLLLDPAWPVRWMSQINTYDGFVPLLTIPGPLLLLALLRWRAERARLCLLLSAIPQRLFYDQLLIWLIPESAPELMMFVCLGWLGYFGAFLTGRAADVWIIITLYLPALLVVLRQHEPRDRLMPVEATGK